MDNIRLVEIGYISACIAGDHRYTSRLSVKVDGEKVHVILEENSAAGGMDGPGGSTPFRETDRTTVDKDPAKVVKAIKQTMDDVIKRYGKPTKNFRWVGIGNGLSVALAKRALDVE